MTDQKIKLDHEGRSAKLMFRTQRVWAIVDAARKLSVNFNDMAARNALQRRLLDLDAYDSAMKLHGEES